MEPVPGTGSCFPSQADARHLPVMARCYTLNMARQEEPAGIQVKATNRKALRDFQIEEKHEAGLVLAGSEIKSIRAGRASLVESYATIEGGEAFVYGMNISSYAQASHFGHDPIRTRKLLLHKDEIKRLTGKIAERGYTLVPLRLYIKDGKAKVELGLARGKRKYDKRREMADRDAAREMARAERRKVRSVAED
jgi:SsrA-binding protein